MSLKFARRIFYILNLCSQLSVDGASFDVIAEAACVVLILPEEVVRLCYQPVSGVRMNPDRPIQIRTIFRALVSNTGHPEVTGFRNRQLGDKIEHRIFLSQKRINQLLLTLTMRGPADFVIKLSSFLRKLQLETDPELLSGRCRRRVRYLTEATRQRPICPRVAQTCRHSTLPNPNVELDLINPHGTESYSQSPFSIQSAPSTASIMESSLSLIEPCFSWEDLLNSMPVLIFPEVQLDPQPNFLPLSEGSLDIFPTIETLEDVLSPMSPWTYPEASGFDPQPTQDDNFC